MTLNLRKAHAVQTKIREVIRGLGLRTTTPVSIYSTTLSDDIAVAHSKFQSAVETRNQLSEALFEIRAKIGKANAASGIDETLARIAALKDHADFLAVIAAAEPRDRKEITEGRIARLRKDEPQPVRGYSSAAAETVEVGLLEADEIAVHKAALIATRREQQNLQDKLLALNVGTNIELTSASTKVLTDAGIL